LKNERGIPLCCSYFEPAENTRVTKQLPCVIYLHGNTSSRLEALAYVRLFLPSNITLFCFDTSGSGLSGGEYISLGWWEKEDLKTVIEFLKNTGRVSRIGLWGRSMGAVTALMYAECDPSISGMILDSAFSDLRKLIAYIGGILMPRTPNFVRSTLIWFVKRSVKTRANFNIDDVTPLNHVENITIPAQFIVANGDTFVPPVQGIELYEKYGGLKTLLKVAGNHNSDRPVHVLSSVYEFFFRVLQVEKLPGCKIVPSQESNMEGFSQVVFPVVKVLRQKNILNDDLDGIDFSNPGTQTSFLFEPEAEINMAIKLSLKTFNEEEKKRKST
jgi:pimeloyl-ACP methyl ester carboxylesterase